MCWAENESDTIFYASCFLQKVKIKLRNHWIRALGLEEEISSWQSSNFYAWKYNLKTLVPTCNKHYECRRYPDNFITLTDSAFTKIGFQKFIFFIFFVYFFCRFNLYSWDKCPKRSKVKQIRIAMLSWTKYKLKKKTNDRNR